MTEQEAKELREAARASQEASQTLADSSDEEVKMRAEQFLQARKQLQDKIKEVEG